MSGTLRPVEVEIENFRSFADKTLVKFPDIKQGAVLISGSSFDGTTSSGTGKSTILMAMAFSLGFCGVPSTELKSWYSKGKPKVRFRLKDDKNTYDVIRDPKLRLLINGEEFGGTSAGAQEKLEDILKACPSLIKVLTYRPQREKGVFLSNTDAKNKEFLTKILNLNSVEEAGEEISKEIVNLKTEISVVERKVFEIDLQLKSLSVSEEGIQAAKVSLEEASARLESLTASKPALEPLRQEISSIDTELSKIYSAGLEVSRAQEQNMSIRQQVEQKQNQIKRLESGVCYTCNREWNQSVDQINAISGQINQLIESMKSNISIIKNAEPIINPDYKNKLSIRKEELQNQINQVSAPIGDAIKARDLAKANLENLLSVETYRKNAINNLQSDQKKLTDLKVNLHIKEHCANLLGRQGFLGSIFDEVLSEIKMRTNELMACVPNINTFSVDISSNSVTKTGKVNKKINVSVYKDGQEKSLNNLSGGQLAALELCTDLAVAETIRSRSGSSLGWVALDEAMDGLDVETKTAALEVIKTKVNGLLIVVDHSTEIKEAFDAVIEVEYDGKRSYVR